MVNQPQVTMGLNFSFPSSLFCQAIGMVIAERGRMDSGAVNPKMNNSRQPENNWN